MSLTIQRAMQVNEEKCFLTFQEGQAITRRMFWNDKFNVWVVAESEGTIFKRIKSVYEGADEEAAVKALMGMVEGRKS